MKDKLLRDIELKLSLQYPADQREKIMQVLISCLNDYDVTERVTDMVVRHEDTNERILRRYVACIRIDGLAESTIRQYVRTLQKLAELICKPYTEMSAYDIRYFLGEMKQRGNKNSSIENQRSYVSSFFQWMFNEEIIQRNPCTKVKTIKVEQEIRIPFSSVEIDKMRMACKRQLDRAVIETLLSSGIRVEELCNLKVSDVDIDKRTLHIRHGKGGKDRIVFVTDVAAEHIKIYLSKRKYESDILFTSKYKNKYGTRGIQDMVSRTADRAGVKGAHPHRFRRTFATEKYNKGMDINTISKLMGHSNIETTKRYIYVADEKLQAEYRRYA